MIRVYVRKGVVEGAEVYADGVLIGKTDATGGVDVPEEYGVDADGNYIDIEITVKLDGATDLITGEKPLRKARPKHIQALCLRVLMKRLFRLFPPLLMLWLMMKLQRPLKMCWK